MKVFVPLLFLLSLTQAEPPVGDGYPSARSSHHHDQHHSSDFQRSLSQEYIPTGSLGRSISEEYGTPNSRSKTRYQPSSDTYGTPESRHSQDYDFQRSGLSQEYGTPISRQLSQGYGTPNTRASLSQNYGPPSVVSARNFGESGSQKYETPSARSGVSQEYGALSQEYDVPSARLSQEYGAPELKNSQGYDALSQDFIPNPLLQEYGVPSASMRNSPLDSYSAPQGSISSQYSAPDFRSEPSDKYGTPSQRNAGFGQKPSQKYGAPGFRSQSRSSVTQKYGVPLSNQGYKNSKSDFARSSPSKSYGAPGLRSPAAKYGAPEARNSDSYSQGYSTPSSLYGVPGQRSLSDTYGAPAKSLSDTYGPPNAKSLSQEYGTPSRAVNLKTTAIASSYAATSSTKSGASSKYGAPSNMPSEQYGVPDQYSGLSGQGYGYGKNAIDEQLNQEPANYDFAYKVNDLESGSDFGHTEERQDNHAEGAYFVVLPDGTKQIVEYEADERGFKPRISVEPADVSRSSGYDENAADLTK